jgi:hypothetical protein
MPQPAVAGSFTFTGPTLPIIGEPILFDIFSAKLTQPTLANPDWELTINTNYGATIPIPPGNNIPTFLVGGVTPYNIGDFLITWDDNLYGIDLFAHDGYTPGDLYQVPTFLTSQAVLASLGALPFRTGLIPVEIGPGGGAPIGVGSFQVTQTGDGFASGTYTITEDFAAPPGFLADDNFSIDISSAICANGVIIGDAVLDTPEPGTMVLFGSALILLLMGRGFRIFRVARLQVRQEAGQNPDRR